MTNRDANERRAERLIAFEQKRELAETKALWRRRPEAPPEVVDMSSVFNTISGMVVVHLVVGLMIAAVWLGSQNGFSSDTPMDSTHLE
jgi:hypothetical protein